MWERVRKDIKKNLQRTIIILILCLIFAMIIQVEIISKAGRVINYAGLVRGGTQRYVKLEILGIHNSEIEHNLDKILAGLLDGSNDLKLTKLSDTVYQNELIVQKEAWENLKILVREIDNSAEKDHSGLQKAILDKSEEYFLLSDKTVEAAEAYSSKVADRLKIIEITFALLVAGLIILIIMGYAEKKRLVADNKELGKKAYIDLHTGLPNKSRCEELFKGYGPVGSDVCCIMFDLNGLKETNDKLGHLYGDEIIKNFAEILRDSIREQDFVGRYGGDEFVAVLFGADKSAIENVCKRIEHKVDNFNNNKNRSKICLSYAYGWAVAEDEEETLKSLLEKADAQMYSNKIEIKEKLKSLH